MLELLHFIESFSPLARRGRILLLLVVSMTTACKPRSTNVSSKVLFAEDQLEADDTRPVVEAGSYKVLLYPPPDQRREIQMLQLFAEPGAQIYISPLPFEYIDDAMLYEQPQKILAPLDVWARARVGDRLGPLYNFNFRSHRNHLGARPDFPARLNSATYSWMDLLYPSDLEIDIPTNPAPDLVLRGRVDDPLGDVGLDAASIDILSLSAEIKENALHLEANLAAALDFEQTQRYHFEIGRHSITAQSFGEMAQFLYRITCQKNLCSFQRTETLPEPPDSARIHFELADDSIKLQVPMDLLENIPSEESFLVRLQTIMPRHAQSWWWDRTLPILLRGKAFVSQSSMKIQEQLNTFKNMNLTLYDLGDRKDALIEDLYHRMTRSIVGMLQHSQKIPFATVSTIPLTILDGNQGALTGLNSTDRGVLTALRSNAGYLSLAQLLAHEYAHFQNAMFPSNTPRWIQEGMSEWASERILYQIFPRADVYRFFYDLRIEGWLNTLNHNFPDPPLSEWQQFEDDSQYEKSLAFFQVLEHLVGDQTIMQIFRTAVSLPISERILISLAERLSGKDLSVIESFWLQDGTVHPDWDPRILFADPDRDGISTMDEQKLHSDPQSPWSTLQPTITDSEMFMLGDSSQSLADYLDEMQTQVHLRPHEQAKLWTIDPSFKQRSLGRPVMLRAPFRAYLTADSKEDPPHIVEQSSYATADGTDFLPDDFAPVKESDGLLPSPALAEPKLESIETLNHFTSTWIPADVVDINHDLPRWFGAYDITKVSYQNISSDLRITIHTNSPFDRLGQKGRYEILIERVRMTPNELPRLEGREEWTYREGRWLLSSSSTLRTGVQQLQRIPTTQESLSLDLNGFTPIAETLEGRQFIRLCVQSRFQIDPDFVLGDDLGCAVIAQGSDLKTTVAEHRIQGDRHQWRLTTPKTQSSSEAEYQARALIGITKNSAHILSRRLLDRQNWSIVMQWNSDHGLRQDLHRRHGIFFSTRPPDDDFTQSAFLYFLSEQLFRLMIEDSKARLPGDSSFFLEELWIQWLGLSATAQVLPRNELNDYFERFRLGQIRCYQAASGCANAVSIRRLFNLESGQGMQNWQALYDGTLRRNWILLFARELQATFGTRVLATKMQSWINGIPPEIDWASWLLTPESSQKQKQFINERLPLWLRGKPGKSSQHFQELMSWWQPGDIATSYQIEIEYLNHLRQINSAQKAAIFGPDATQ